MGDVVLTSAFPQWVQDLNTGLSLIGFFITLYVLYEVKNIKCAFLARARLPELIKELSKAGSALNASLADWPTKRNEARGQVKIAATLLKSSFGMLPKPEKNELTQIQLKLVDAARTFSNQEYDRVEVAWDIYSDIQSSITSLNQVAKNMKWE